MHGKSIRNDQNRGMHDKLTLLPLLMKSNEDEEKQKSQMYLSLSEIRKKTPTEAHEIIATLFYYHQKRIQELTEHNKELWLQIQEYKNNRHEATQEIMEKIWDNEEDEFWDDF